MNKRGFIITAKNGSTYSQSISRIKSGRLTDKERRELIEALESKLKALEAEAKKQEAEKLTKINPLDLAELEDITDIALDFDSLELPDFENIDFPELESLPDLEPLDFDLDKLDL